MYLSSMNILHSSPSSKFSRLIRDWRQEHNTEWMICMITILFFAVGALASAVYWIVKRQRCKERRLAKLECEAALPKGR
jgi:hypothetical protein